MPEPHRREAWPRRVRYALDVVAAVLAVLVYLSFIRIPGTPGAPGYTGPYWLGVLVAAGVGVPLVVRRRWPLPVFGVVLAASVTAIALYLTREPLTPLAFAMYLVAVSERPRRSVPALIVAVFAASVAILLTNPNPIGAGWETGPGLAAFVALATGTGWLLGYVVRQRRATAAQAAEQRARQAVHAERLRIARELHDVVAHGMSLINVKAGIANHVAEQRPAEAHEALRVIEATSRDALTDMRRMLGVLRAESPEDEPGHGLAPAPGLAQLDALAERTRLTGVRVDLDVQGDRHIPETVGLSVYRIVQEALTNVVKHAAPAPCRVTVRVHADRVCIDVTDDGPGAHPPGDGGPGHGPGHGLIGMRERAMMHGGTFSAGPEDGCGFAVRATLPYEPHRENV